MAPIKIISATPGPNTTERIVSLIQNYPEGITIGELKQVLNRPVSMLLHCLKPLVLAGQVRVGLSENGMQRIYYPVAKKV